MNEFKWYDIFSPFVGIDLTTFYIGGAKKPRRVALSPANISTGFGTATANPQTGQYGYTLDPRLSALRDEFYGATNQFLPSAQQQQFAQGMVGQGQGLFGIGTNQLNQAVGVNPNDIASQYFNDIQNLQAPNRAIEASQLADQLFKTGRSGAATAFNGGFVNPEQFALLQARNQQDGNLAIQAQTFGRDQMNNDIRRALGLQEAGAQQIQTGEQLRMQPFQQANSIFGLGTGIEGLGANNLNTAINAASLQMQAQQQQQATENARAQAGSGGGFLGGLANAGLQIGLAKMTGGGSLFGGMGGSSPTSGLGSVFGNNGFFNGVGAANSSYSPFNSNIGMGGFGGPANFGGGTLGPSF